MTVFTTFQQAAEAARKKAILGQQTIYLLRVLEDSWSISSEALDSQNQDPAARQPNRNFSVPRKPETGSPDWEDCPF